MKKRRYLDIVSPDDPPAFTFRPKTLAEIMAEDEAKRGNVMTSDRTAKAIPYSQTKAGQQAVVSAAQKQKEDKELKDNVAKYYGYKDADDLNNAVAKAQEQEKEVGAINPMQEPEAYQSYYKSPISEGWDNAAANLGYALGSNHPMTLNEFNKNTLGVAELMGWIAAPEAMAAFEVPYYAATNRPKQAALTALATPYIPGGKTFRSLRSRGALPWTLTIPKNPNMAYRIMGPLEKDWIMAGNELSLRKTNPLTEVEAAKAMNAAKAKGDNFSKILDRFSGALKVGAEHGNRKQFSKGEPWGGSTTTFGESQVLAIPGTGFLWKAGKHYRVDGIKKSPSNVIFEDAPIGSHIDLQANKQGYTGVNPSLLPGSIIYSPFNIFGHKFGYTRTKLKPK